MTLPNRPEPTLSDVIRQAMDWRLSRVHVCMPGRVTAYDPTTCTADIEPCIKETIVGEDAEHTEALPVLANVPVAFPRVGSSMLTFPLAVGDYVRLVFSERSLNVFRQNGGVVDAIDLRMHNLADAIADPCGAWPTSEALSAHADNVVLGFTSGAQLHLKSSGEVALGAETPAHFVAMANLVLTRLNAIENAFNLHTHGIPALVVAPQAVSGGNTSGGFTGTGTTLAGPTALTTTTVASTKVRASD